MKREKTPKKVVLCWNCQQPLRTHILPGVRQVICPHEDCGVIHPCESQEEYDMRAKEYGHQARTL